MNSSNRRGLTMLVVMAVMAVAACVLAYAMESIVDHHRQARLRHEHRQCRLLSEAGIARAQSKLAGDAEYSGEKWTLVAAETGLAHDVLVSIEVKQDEGDEPLITATTQYPATGRSRVKHTEQRIWGINR